MLSAQATPIHFILCTERTGSSLLSLIMNLHPQVISPSEEPFALYFHKAYKNKTQWTEPEIHKFIDEFWLMAEKSLELFFTSKENLYNALVPHKNNLPYSLLVRLIYLQFIEPKPKEEVKLIVDKQIKYFFYLEQLVKLFPEAKFIVLVRDPRVNAQRKKLRNLNSGSSAIYLSAIWKNTYQNIYYLEKQARQVKVVKYEDLAFDPESTVKDICGFLGIAYLPQMIATQGMYKTFLEIQKDKIDVAHLDHLKDFHSGLFTEINTGKVSLKDDEMDERINGKIVRMTLPLLKKFGYETYSATAGTLNLNDRFQILKAYLYRPWLIRLYLHIPLAVKLMIKRLRK
jgi:hypothetical protein